MIPFPIYYQYHRFDHEPGLGQFATPPSAIRLLLGGSHDQTSSLTSA